MHYTTTMTSKGQVTIPVAIRRRLKLAPGQRVQFNVTNASVKIEPAEDWKAGLEAIQYKVAAHLKKHNIKPLSDEELDRAINNAAEMAATERYLRSLR